MARMYRNSVLYLLIVFIVQIVSSDDVCTKRGPCRCVFGNGSGYDLTPSAAGSKFSEAQQYTVGTNGSEYKLHTFYYHPCNDILPNFPPIPSGKGTCNQKLSICRLINKMTHSNVNNSNAYEYIPGEYELLGSEEATQFSKDGRSIIYGNRPSQTIMLLICAESEDKLHSYSLDEPNKLVLAFYSRNACMKQLEAQGRSFGSNLLIIFFTLIIFYLVLGIGTKKFLMGATGVEVIPNISFWMDLPNLVKDGWAFALNGFKLPPRASTTPQTSPDPSSYDAI